MISRNLYFQIVLRVLIIVLLALIAGWFVAEKKATTLAVLCLLVLIPLVISLIRYLNTTNRKMMYFLESVQNNDSSLIFPSNITNKSVTELYKSLNKVNDKIQQLKIENQQREHYFQALLEHVATGIITFTSKGFILHANTAVKKMLEIDVLTHVNQLERINNDLFTTIQHIKPFEQKLVTVATTRGISKLSLKATSFKTKNEELILLSIQDIRNELDEKELDSWMKLIRVLMHEIMNSIAPITSLSESLSRFFTIDGRAVLPGEVNQKTIETTLRGLNVIKEQGSGLMLFVESYRKLTRLPKPDKKIFAVEELVNRIKTLYFSLENSSNVALSVSISPPGLELFADQNLISQVLINLLKNALEAIGNTPGGRIGIVAGYAPGKHPQICVNDNGPGIPGDIMEQIFIPFFTTRTNGSGIGLSLSRQIMRMHGGSIHVWSTPNTETQFCLVF